jgi:hypothetical protein
VIPGRYDGLLPSAAFGRIANRSGSAACVEWWGGDKKYRANRVDSIAVETVFRTD